MVRFIRSRWVLTTRSAEFEPVPKYVANKPFPFILLQSPAMFRLYHHPNGCPVLRSHLRPTRLRDSRCTFPCGLGSGLTLLRVSLNPLDSQQSFLIEGAILLTSINQQEQQLYNRCEVYYQT